MKARKQAATQLNLLEQWDEPHLLATAVALGASHVSQWSETEKRQISDMPAPHAGVVEAFRQQIREGSDPLGTVFSMLRSPERRRSLGATYTPQAIVQAMLAWVRTLPCPDRVVDPGTGSARFLVAAGRALPNASLVGNDIDPVATIIARGHLAAAGFADRSLITLEDYRAQQLPAITGRTLFIGNPPYVRHHAIDSDWKSWLAREARSLGFTASQLAGLHAYFLLRTAKRGRPGDIATFVTSAEWLDVNYGSLIRQLFLGPLGGTSITVVEPAAMPFPDAATTAVVTTYEIGTVPEFVSLARVDTLAALVVPDEPHVVSRERLENERRWSHFTRGPRNIPAEYVELGELCRVHRGTVTGANKVWIAGHSVDLPEPVLFPTVTRAKELINSGTDLADSRRLRNVIDLPEDLDSLERDDRRRVDRYLTFAKTQGADQGYIARYRKAWWSVGLREPAPILATYMARRAPAFVRNSAAARHINIAHGLYPREPFSESMLTGLVEYLSRSTDVRDGRTYAGGLTKFEPREMERLLVPRPEALAAGAY